MAGSDGLTAGNSLVSSPMRLPSAAKSDVIADILAVRKGKGSGGAGEELVKAVVLNYVEGVRCNRQ